MISITLNARPYHVTHYMDSVSGGGRAQKSLPFLQATVQGLPASAPPLLATADLQGRVHLGESPDGLVGCWLATQLAAIHRTAGQPDPAQSIALLAGDFYTVPGADRRGGTGDVDAVWRRLAASFHAVIGVTGNHDLFAEPRPAGCLDGHIVEIDGLRLGGVSGIIGNPQKPNRHPPEQFLAHLAQVVARKPHVLLLHSAPHVDATCRGDRLIADSLVQLGYDGLVVCGHVHWAERVRHLGAATILNVHEAVVCILPSGSS